MYVRQLFFILGGRRIPGHGAEALFDGACFNARCHIKCYFSSNFFCIKSWKKVGIKHFLKFCSFWTRFVTLTYPFFALFEILLFLDTFCNTIVSDYRTGEFGLSAWTLSLLSYLEKSIYQNSRVKSRASENCCGGRLFRVHSTLPVGSVQLRVQHLRVKNLDLAFGKIQLRVQHFGAEKLDNELNIKWDQTFRMTCNKTGDVFLRHRLII